VFIAKLDTDGNWLWAQGGGGPEEDIGKHITVDSEGNCYASGTFESNALFGPASVRSIGLQDIFVSKLDTNGNWLWTNQAGSTSYDNPNGISNDRNGNCYLIGYFNSSATFGYPRTFSAVPVSGGFIAKLNPNGNWLWKRTRTGTGYVYNASITTDNQGKSFITGRFSGQVIYGSSLLNNWGGFDIFAAKIDGNGNWLWGRSAGWYGDESSIGIGVDVLGFCYITGSFNALTYFNGNPLYPHGSYNLFLAKLNTDAVSAENDVVPVNSGISLLSNAYPNPFHIGETAQIKTQIADKETGTLSIYNLKGQLIESHNLTSGNHNISLNSRDLASGIYFYRLTTLSTDISRKLILLK
jgi:hypothetical protein